MSERRLRPLSDWFPAAGTAPTTAALPAAGDAAAPGQERVLVRLAGDLDRESVLLAAVLRVFDAQRGSGVLIAVAGVPEPRPADADAIGGLLASLAEDPADLPDVELVGDDHTLDGEVDVVVEGTGTAWGDAETVLQLASLWRP
ncbi:hypothetical protein GTR02_18875 [Kineococcus sp. R8]|uniref:hypothetical protein n=1 Tax=Kineococcus siccus TaxID=2696567 RepID=UPI001412AA8B|nr:hypothetical protein [Kineococcus siccus]NAZ83878.1 hypothetical protein [Kineococcus siccus]